MLLARDADGRIYAGEAAIDVRAAVADDRTAFLDVVRALGLKLDLAALTIFARWITPPVDGASLRIQPEAGDGAVVEPLPAL